MLAPFAIPTQTPTLRAWAIDGGGGAEPTGAFTFGTACTIQTPMAVRRYTVSGHTAQGTRQTLRVCAAEMEEKLNRGLNNAHSPGKNHPRHDQTITSKRLPPMGSSFDCTQVVAYAPS